MLQNCRLLRGGRVAPTAGLDRGRRLAKAARRPRALACRPRASRLQAPSDRRPARHPTRRPAHRWQPTRRHPAPAAAGGGPADPGPARTASPQATTGVCRPGYDFDTYRRLLWRRGVKPLIARRGVVGLLQLACSIICLRRLRPSGRGRRQVVASEGQSSTVSSGHCCRQRAVFVSYTSRGASTGLGRTTRLKTSASPCGA